MTGTRALTLRNKLMERRRVLVSQRRNTAPLDRELRALTTQLLAKATGFRRRRR